MNVWLAPFKHKPSVQLGQLVTKHDTVSFMLGMLKEFKDVFSPGNAEATDFKADVLGVTAVECLSQCDL
jgi:hypothetical protein